MTSIPKGDKWRPTLGLIVFAVLSTVMALPLLGLFFFRLYDNQLIRQTEAELIAQGVVISAVFAREVESKLATGIELGGEIAPDAHAKPGEKFTPIKPGLDLAGDDLLPRRPYARASNRPVDPKYLEIAAKLRPIVDETQKATLGGFRILDPYGTVIVGREETGLSLAHLEEVADALRGHYRGALRIRSSDPAPPPIYSLSRGRGLRVFSAMPVVVNDRIAGVVYISRTPNSIFRHFYDERGKFILATLAVIGATLIIGLVFWRTVTRPMYQLVARTVAVGRGDRDAFRSPMHYGTREFALLSRSFADMAEQLSHRSDHIATFAAHLTHELKSPLTSIKGAAELLQDSAHVREGRLTEAEQKSLLGNIVGDTGRLEALVHRLRELARAESAHGEGTTTLRPLIADLQRRFPAMRFSATGDLDRSFGMSEENALIALSHLVDNAARHHATEVSLHVSDDDRGISLTVQNDGEAISEHNRDRIFDAFFTTRRDEGGTGMGLAIVESMLRTSGASIRLLRPEAGAAFEIRFAGG
jgi:signal transduction histidine kinase